MLRRTIDLLLPALFPSWRFFKQVGPSPRVEYRILNGGQGSEWCESHPIPDDVGLGRMARRMIWNPARNTQLYMVALAERLVSGLVDHSEAELNRLIAENIPEVAGEIQFRLMFMTPEDDQIIGTVVYESQPVSLSELRV
ncbi:MAG: hypothetical protein JXQ85_03670 [Cognatishimia sp.]|uniref:hypothetical protein n=1 Tax=Cognatishimia sp. TaxID=2211648 RepID=UPI003B8C11DC